MYDGYNGTLVLGPDHLVIWHRGIPARMLGRPDHYIPQNLIAGIRTKPPSRLINGWIIVDTIGSTQIPERVAPTSPNAILFKYSQRETFEVASAMIRALMHNNESALPPPPISATPAIVIDSKSAPIVHPAPVDMSVEDIAKHLSWLPIHEPLDEQVEVAGETYYTKGIRKIFRAAGAPITTRGTTLEDRECVLVADPWNEHDPNAVAVVVEGHQVGHIPAALAREYSPVLLSIGRQGSLVTGIARVWAKSDSSMIRARVTILIPEIELLR